MNQFFGLYIHWPFCISKCPYCDFNSHIQTSIDEEEWKQAYLAELERLYHRIGHKELRTIYFGGGTPSLMPTHVTAAIIEKAYQLWTTSPTIEITLEANPNSIEINKLAAFKDAGINRVSIGVQSLIDKDLQFLKRAHSKDEAIKAIAIAANLFDRYSFDLIYARPHQTIKSWQEELKFALSLAQDHLSLYQLTIEPNTAFHTQFHRGKFKLPDEELATELYLSTHDQLKVVNMFAYEVSNFAKRGSESRHNLLYWHYDDYAGIGPGAHGRLTIGDQKIASHQYRVPHTWLEKVKHDSGIQDEIKIEKNDQIKEALMMGLRLEQGICLESFKNKFGTSLENLFHINLLEPLIEEDLLVINNKYFKCTLNGRLKLNGVLNYLFDKM